jgi:hypothetical protein
VTAAHDTSSSLQRSLTIRGVEAWSSSAAASDIVAVAAAAAGEDDDDDDSVVAAEDAASLFLRCRAELTAAL